MLLHKNWKKTAEESVTKMSSGGLTQRQTNLRIVLIGGRELGGIEASGKSSTGNTLLCKDVFQTNRRTARSVAKQGMVHGRQLTVVDTPGWWWHYPRENTPMLDQFEITHSVYLCPPGPNVFLLIIPVDSGFPVIYKKALDEHLQLFNREVWSQTIVLFSAVNTPNYETLQRHIEKWPALQELIRLCGNRGHILDVRNTNDETQVVRLLEKMEDMMKKNGGGHYQIDRAVEQTLEENMLTVSESAKKRFADVKTQRGKLRAVIEATTEPPEVPHLRLVIVGAQWAARSSAGNTILGKYVFKVGTSRTTFYCETKHGTVAGRQLTVVDSPGWFYNSTLADTAEMDKLEIQRSVCQCPLGPHAVLLVVPFATAFNQPYQRAVEEHMGLFKEEVWKHTIMLFTRGDWLGDTTVEERIESEWEGLRHLVNKCGNRYHAFDNMALSGGTQVSELLDKVEEMVAGNGGGYYEIDPGYSEALETKRRTVEERAKKYKINVQKQRTVLRELFRGEEKKFTHMKLVLIGRKNAGKSCAGNTMLFGEFFESSHTKESQDKSGTLNSMKQQRKVAGIDLTVVDSPGWHIKKQKKSQDALQEEIVRTVSMCSPGPDAFLLVVPIHEPFTKRDAEALVKNLRPFTKRVWKHALVLFTWGDWLGERSIEEHIESEGKFLRWLVEECGHRYHVLKCHDWGDGSQVAELCNKVRDMITRNKGQHFTIEEKKPQKPMLYWLAGKGMMTEEEWNTREEDLINRMLKAMVMEPEKTEEPGEAALPLVRRRGSFNENYIPSMHGGDTASNVESSSWSHRAPALGMVFEWLNATPSAYSSGYGSTRDSHTNAGASDALSQMDESLSEASATLLINLKNVQTFANPRSIQNFRMMRSNSF